MALHSTSSLHSDSSPSTPPTHARSEGDVPQFLCGYTSQYEKKSIYRERRKRSSSYSKSFNHSLCSLNYKRDDRGSSVERQYCRISSKVLAYAASFCIPRAQSTPFRIRSSRSSQGMYLNLSLAFSIEYVWGLHVYVMISRVKDLGIISPKVKAHWSHSTTFAKFNINQTGKTVTSSGAVLSPAADHIRRWKVQNGTGFPSVMKKASPSSFALPSSGCRRRASAESREDRTAFVAGIQSNKAVLSPT